MTSFSIFESFLFFSLATTFVLILLLFYHFKGRLSSIEKKCDTLFEISQNLAAQIQNNSISSSKLVDIHTDNDIVNVKKFEEINNLINEDDIEEIEIDDDEYENESNESENGIKDENEEVSDDEDSYDGDDSDTESDKEAFEETPNIEKIDIPTVNNDEIYKKMPVAELRQLVITKGLSTQPSKLKKNELLDLLNNN